MLRLLPFMLLLQTAGACAAAWTQDEGAWQLISGVISSDADRSFDDGSRAVPALFQRQLLQNDIEYGWTGSLTLLARTETAYVRTRSNGVPVSEVNNAFEGGARYLLARGPGLVGADDVLSVEGSVRTAGAFNFAYSANADSGGQDGGLRLLYGSGFRFWDRDGFVDFEAGYRWVSRPRPDQMPVDLTAGLWLAPRWMVMVQSFNLFSGAATAPYVPFRMHKLELSGAWKLTQRLTLQAGAFLSPAGRNALDERGLCLSVWADF